MDANLNKFQRIIEDSIKFEKSYRKGRSYFTSIYEELNHDNFLDID